MKKEELFERIKGKVIVSCQAVPGEPLYVEEKSVMYLMANKGNKEGDSMKKEELFERIKGKVIVSCQAVPGEPLYVEEKSVMYLMARNG